MTSSIETGIFNALQQADEIGGPEAPEYIALMLRVAKEATERAQNALQHLPHKITFELGENAEGKQVWTFDHGGVAIEDPTKSPCSRFEVDPISYYGLTKEQVRDLRYRNYQLSIEPVLVWCREHINANAYGLDTGGGCMAISLPRGDDGGYWLITVADDAEIPKTITEPVAVGCYDKDGEEWILFQCADLPAAAVLIGSYKTSSV